jgi:TRAP-type C4-dicarboxylate transport system permease small subunit
MTRKPAIGHVMGLITSLLGAFFMGLIQVGSVPYLIDAWNKDYYVGIEGMFTAPQWPIALIIVIAIVVTMIQFLINFATHLRSLVQRG